MQKIIDAVNRALGARAEADKMKIGEVCPTDAVPVYINTACGVFPSLMRWGFPGYQKKDSKAKPQPIINARSETVEHKPTFSPFLANRCLVPACQYYDWAVDPSNEKKKIKYAFEPVMDTASIFWMAAIFQELGGGKLPVFTILTMAASPSVAPIHDRMPVIFGNEDARLAWIRGEKDIKGLIEREAVREIDHRLAA
jgi:putative SOS response-associated peptidase YedK